MIDIKIDQSYKCLPYYYHYYLWDFQLNTEVTQQLHENQPSLDLVEILNVSSEDGGESSLNITLEEVLAAGAVEETAAEDDEIGRVPRS